MRPEAAQPGAVEATQAYERWLRRQTPIVAADLAAKHARLRENAFVFLRGTFYLWLLRWQAVAGVAADAPLVLSVGDLHVENFGTWRDAEGRLVWGVNDVDEACVLPYTQDLVRLATSTWLASRRGQLALTRRDACRAILEGYRDSIANGGEPIVLSERRRWLRDIALGELRDPTTFWNGLITLPAATGRRVPRALLTAELPANLEACRVARRMSGVGSLGRQRYVALAQWQGGFVAREAKAFVPSALSWVTGKASAQRCMDLVSRGVRARDPFYDVRDGWIVRRLAPDCARIELTDLPKKRDERKLLRAMGWETANLHLGSGAVAAAAIARDLKRRPAGWLEDAATGMRDVVLLDWNTWTRRARAAGNQTGATAV